jgi:hypothetical protein
MELVGSPGNRSSAHAGTIGDAAVRDGSSGNWLLANRVKGSGDDAIGIKDSSQAHLVGNLAQQQ